MTIKTRVNKLEAKHKPAGKIYVLWDDKNQVTAHPGGQMTKAEFEALPKQENDFLINVRYVGVDLGKIQELRK